MPAFDPKRTLRQISNELLRELFVAHGHELDVPWDEISETNVADIFQCWQELTEPERRAIEILFRDIDEIASVDGVKAIVEEAIRQGEESLTETIGQFDSRHDRAVWTYLHGRDVWNMAIRFARADLSSRGRYWVKRNGLPAKEPDTTEETMALFETSLSAFFARKEARGAHCKIEHYVRASGVDYFFAYLDDYAGTVINFSNEGDFARTPERRAFEVVFAYDSEHGTLDMYAKGGKKVYVPLQEIFCFVILSEQIEEENRDCQSYALNNLLSREFQFPTDLDDGIIEVRVRRLRLSIKGSPRQRITLEADPNADVDDIYRMIESYLDSERLPSSIVNVSSVSLKLSFDHDDPDLPRSMSFDVSYPNSSNLKSKPEGLRELGEKYLKEWGIDRVETAQHNQPAS